MICYSVWTREKGAKKSMIAHAGDVNCSDPQSVAAMLIGILSDLRAGAMNASRLTEITVTVWPPDDGPATPATE